VSSPELDALIVEHLADLDRAAEGIADIEKRIFTAFGARAGAWAKSQGWSSDFDYPEGGWDNWVNWLAPAEWRTTDTAVEDEKFDGKFQFDGVTARKDRFVLTSLCGAGVDHLGFWFVRPEFIRVRKWKQAFPRLAELVKNTGFVWQDDELCFFRPVTIQPANLAQALLEEDIDAALGPFDAALESLLHARPAFDEVLRSLRVAES
jgi:hypothetical protein